MLANVIGQIIGTSLSPELLVGVALIIWQSRPWPRFVLALGIVSAAVIALRFVLVPDFRPMDAVIVVLALALWSGIGALIRSRLPARQPVRRSFQD